MTRISDLVIERALRQWIDHTGEPRPSVRERDLAAMRRIIEDAFISLSLERPAASPAVRPQSLARESYERAWHEKERLR